MERESSGFDAKGTTLFGDAEDPSRHLVSDVDTASYAGNRHKKLAEPRPVASVYAIPRTDTPDREVVVLSAEIADTVSVFEARTFFQTAMRPGASVASTNPFATPVSFGRMVSSDADAASRPCAFTRKSVFRLFQVAV